MRYPGAAVMLAAMAWAVAAAWARADDVPLDLTVEQEGTQGTTQRGTSQNYKRDVVFVVKLHNKGMDDLSGIGVKLYVMAGPNSPDPNQTKQQLRVVRVLSHDGLAIPSSQDAQAEMGSVNFASATSTRTYGNGDGTATVETDYSGDVYRGYVAEIYVGGKLADVRIGNGSMKKAYEDYLAAPPPVAGPNGRPLHMTPPAVLSLVSPAPGSTQPAASLPVELSLSFAPPMMGPLPLPTRPADASPSEEPVQAVGESVAFSLQVRNLGAADLSNVAVKIFAVTHNFAGPPGVGAVLGAGPLAVAAGGTATASLGPAVTFIMPMGGMRPAGGHYEGYVLELYLDGNLVGVAASNPMARQIYDASVQAHPDKPLYAGLEVPWMAKGARPGGQTP